MGPSLNRQNLILLQQTNSFLQEIVSSEKSYINIKARVAAVNLNKLNSVFAFY